MGQRAQFAIAVPQGYRSDVSNAFCLATCCRTLTQLVNDRRLVDLFAVADTDPRLLTLRDLLLAYRAALLQTHLSHFGLSGVSLPDSLDPSVPFPMPGRIRVLGHLLKSSLASFVRLPFFLLPLLVHLPIYVVGAYSVYLAELEEDRAQIKIALGLVLAIGTYVALFSLACVGLVWVPLGFVAAAVFVVCFWLYHQRLIDDNYNAGKRLVASWRVLVGIWAPVARSRARDALRRHSISLAYSPLQSNDSPRLNRQERGSATNSPSPQARASIDGSAAHANGHGYSTANGNGSASGNGSGSGSGSGSGGGSGGGSGAGYGYGYEEENAVRQVLRLRVQANQALCEYLEARVREDFEGEELVRRLVEWGAGVGRGRERLGSLAEATRS